MAGGENEPQPVVANLLLDIIEIGARQRLASFGLAAEVGLFALQRALSPQHVVPTPRAHRNEPCARALRHPGDGPLLQGRDEGIVGEVLGQPDVAGAACQCCYDPGRLDPPNSFVRAVGGDAGLACFQMGHCPGGSYFSE
jgi:hypothetical protein